MADTALKILYKATAREHDFWQQVAGACIKSAHYIENEDPGTENHANRLIWAASVKSNAKAMAIDMLSDVLSNATIAADVENASDTDVQWMVDSLINTYAG